jgi:L-alanine-DL-glutamate epimerase-like enolase superfamily enzyme
MERRSFLKLTGALTILPAAAHSSSENWFTRKADLSYHRIESIKFSSVKMNYPRLVGKNSRLDVHGTGPVSGIHILYTDKGASGWGLNRGNEKNLTEKFELIKGKSVDQLLVPETGALEPAFEPFDFSLFDLAGKITKKPVYQLLGVRRPETQLCYSGMIYFDDLEPAGNPAGTAKILEECRWDYNYGYRQFKLKIGRAYKWMDKEAGLKRDIEVTKLVAESFPDCDILVDGNNGFTVDEFIRYLDGIGEIKLFWIEEPFHETIDDYVKLYSWLRSHNKTPLLADGEASPDEKVLRTLGSQKIINVFLQDIASYGFTRWISMMKEIKAMGILASPHNWGTAVKTNYCAHLAGAFGSTATVEGVTCSSDDVDLTGYKLKEGRLIPSPKPGFGMELLKKV